MSMPFASTNKESMSQTLCDVPASWKRTATHRLPKSTQTAQDTPLDAPSLLHTACKLHPTVLAIVKRVLDSDPSAIRQPTQRQRHEYSYPINIALKHQASADVIQLLAQQAPDVLLRPDGPIQTASLGIALQENVGLDVIDVLLRANPDCARTSDRHQNLPLHLAVRSPQVTWELIQRIHQTYPDALFERNFRNETPLDVAVRSPFCPDAIVDGLRRLSYSKIEADLEEEERDYSK